MPRIGVLGSSCVSTSLTHLVIALLSFVVEAQCSSSYQDFFREIILCVAVVVSMGGGEFRIYLHCHLELPSPLLLLYHS